MRACIVQENNEVHRWEKVRESCLCYLGGTADPSPQKRQQHRLKPGKYACMHAHIASKYMRHAYLGGRTRITKMGRSPKRSSRPRNEESWKMHATEGIRPISRFILENHFRVFLSLPKSMNQLAASHTVTHTCAHTWEATECL